MKNENNINDLEQFKSEFEDILGGLEYRSEQTGTEVNEENWVKYPGREMVYGKEEDNTEVTYPLLTINAVTKKALNVIEDLMLINKYNYNKDLDNDITDYNIIVSVYKTWDDGTATYVGKGILNHNVWLRLYEMKLNPKLFMEKGKPCTVNSGVLFDYSKYNPIILEEDDKIVDESGFNWDVEEEYLGDSIKNNNLEWMNEEYLEEAAKMEESIEISEDLKDNKEKINLQNEDENSELVNSLENSNIYTDSIIEDKNKDEEVTVSDIDDLIPNIDFNWG